MCGRFAFDDDLKQLENRFCVKADFQRETRHDNISPGMFVPIVKENAIVLARWGLVPSWSREPKTKFSTFNARAETIRTSPLYKKLFVSQRCLVLATGFYEWKRVSEKEKVPYFIHLTNEKLFAFAGLWDEWKDAEGHPMRTFTIITTEPNALMESIHNRMPVILESNEEELWLTNQDVLLDPYPEQHMEAYPKQYGHNFG